MRSLFEQPLVGRSHGSLITLRAGTKSGVRLIVHAAGDLDAEAGPAYPAPVRLRRRCRWVDA